MKRKGRHRTNTLTPVAIKALNEPGKYPDGQGLYLVVARSGAKRWMLRTTVKGRRCDLGLGGLQTTSLSEARRKADEHRRVAKSGGDPLAQKRSQKSIPTFAEAVRIVHSNLKSGWKNEKHVDQWINTLNAYAVPHLGGLRVDEIDTPDVLKALAPIWMTKQETARRLRQRIGVVLDWAKTAGFRKGENPVDGVTNGLPKQNNKPKHHAALPYADAPAFVTKLRQSNLNHCTKLAFELLLLTAVRTNELLKMQWCEIEGDVWRIPAERTKPKREFRVPLVTRSMEIIDQARCLSNQNGYVFPGQKAERPLSNMVFLMALRRMKLPYDVTGHGFRSTLTDWGIEQTSYSYEIREMALNHTIKNKTEAAYRRGDLFEKRREYMSDWANFVTSETI